MTPIGSSTLRRCVCRVIVAGVVAGLALVADRAEAQQPPQPQPGYLGEIQAPPGYGQPSHAQPGPMVALAQGSQHARQESSGRVPRLILGPLISYALGGTLAVVGSLIGSSLGGCSTFRAEGDLSGVPSGCLAAVFTGVLAGFLLGTPLGVALVGEWFHGMSSFGYAFLGALAGVAVAAVISAVALDFWAVYVAGLLPLTGAIIGYELSSSASASAELAGLALTPIFDHGVLTGGTAGVRLAF